MRHARRGGRGRAGAAGRALHSIGELREHELCCAAEALGLRKVHFLGYRDSGMPGTADNQNPQALVQAPVEKVAAQVAAYIRELQPQVVLTFDPVGGYMHPDHIAIHNATVLGFEMAGDPKAKGSVAATVQTAKTILPHYAARLYETGSEAYAVVRQGPKQIWKK